MVVSIIGVGETKVGEHWDVSLRDLAVQSLHSAIENSAVDKVDALYIGNMLSGELSDQEQLGTLISVSLEPIL